MINTQSRDTRDKLFKLLLDNNVIYEYGNNGIYCKSRGWIDKYAKVYNSNTQLCDSWFSLFTNNNEAWYCLTHNTVPEDHKCIICGSNALYHKNAAIEGYLNYCSKQCRSTGQKQKLEATNIERHGDPNYRNPKKNKITCFKKYGADHYSKTEEYKERSKSTCLKKYNVEYSFQSENNKIKTRETNLNRYGVENYVQTENFKQKASQTKQNRYGDSNYNNPNKVKQTKQNRYGDSNYNNREKAIKTNINKYGVENPTQNPVIHNKILSHKDMTIPEKKLDEFLNNRGFNYQYEYNYNGKNFDFAIFKDNKLAILIEIDGEYYHGLIKDPDNKHVHGDKDCERFLKVPDNVKFIACDSMNIEQCFDEILRIFNLNYSEWIQEVINSLPREFPYPTYNDKRLIQDYERLCKYYNINKQGRLADSTIRQFHKSIWSAHLNGYPSPLEAWNDKKLLEKCVRNRFIYSNNLSSQSIVNGFNICKLAPKVSVFSASTAKYLILKYLNEYNTIFDPFSGFSGRMLGACACNMYYIGQDISEEHVKESNEIIKYHNLNAEIKMQDILTDNNNTYDCLFTCPPYNLKEIWNDKNTPQDFSCDEWIDICLSKYNCKKYLFVIDKTEKYKNYIVEQISNRGHLGKNEEYIVCL